MEILWVLFVLANLVAGERNAQKSGPYKSILLSASECKNSTHLLEKDFPIQIHMKAVTLIGSGSSRDRVLNVNMTVLRNTKDVKLRLRSYAWDGTKWRLTSLMNRVSCNGRLFSMIAQAISFSMFDAAKCTFLKGTFSFSGMDINKMQHLLISTMEYGRLLWRCELNVGLVYYCWEFQTVVERA